jgi:hypothetical protein
VISRIYGIDGKRIWVVLVLVVLSHYLLDGIVHVAGLPLAGENSPKLGLGLWNHMRLELTIETLMAVIGVAMYWRLAGSSKSMVSRYGMAAFVALVTAMTWSQLGATAPPPAQQLKVAWIVAPVLFALVAYGLDRKRVRAAVREVPGVVPNP